MLSLNDFTMDQVKAIDHLYENDETLLIAPTGFGKCAVAFTAIAELLRDEVVSRVLVLSTAQVCTQTWATEAGKWQHLLGLDYVVLTGRSADERKALYESDARIVICNFDNLDWLFSELGELNFDGLLVDEITKLKAVGGEGYKRLRKRGIERGLFHWRCGMTADPVAQESTDIYGQMLIIDSGKRLGRNQEGFLRKYFMQMDYHGRKWDFQPGGRERLAKTLRDVIYRVDGTEYTERLPELVDIEIPIELPVEARILYNTMIKSGAIDTEEGLIEAPNEAVLQGKLHQICNGAIYYKEATDQEDGSVELEQRVHHIHRAKFDALHDLLNRIDVPVLVSYEFDFQLKILQQEFDGILYSAKNSKKTNRQIIEDWNAGEIEMLLIHPQSGAHGLNLQYGPCCTLICMTYLWSADNWKQLVARIWRQGQRSKVVTRYTLCTMDTIEDCVISPRLESRGDASTRFHEYFIKTKGDLA